MPRKLRRSRPIITLTTDFGLSDSYVAEMKGAILRKCSEVCLIDMTHQVPRHDVLYGSIMIERAISAFEAGTVHLAVVDPGVGSKRRLIVAQIAKQWIVCPDNGLITWAWRMFGVGKVSEITWRPKTFSSTFHGRDILAPVAAQLACQQSLRGLAIPAKSPVLLDIAPSNTNRGQIIHIDSFGNCITNLTNVQKVRVRCFRIAARKSYSDVRVGQPLAITGSSGLLEIALRDGSAAEKLHLEVGDRVELV